MREVGGWSSLFVHGVAIGGVISPLFMGHNYSYPTYIYIYIYITSLITTHEPPSMGFKWRFGLPSEGSS